MCARNTTVLDRKAKLLNMESAFLIRGFLQPRRLPQSSPRRQHRGWSAPGTDSAVGRLLPCTSGTRCSGATLERLEWGACKRNARNENEMTQAPRAAAYKFNKAGGPPGPAGRAGAQTKQVWGKASRCCLSKSSQGARVLLVCLSMSRHPASAFIDGGGGLGSGIR